MVERVVGQPAVDADPQLGAGRARRVVGEAVRGVAEVANVERRPLLGALSRRPRPRPDEVGERRCRPRGRATSGIASWCSKPSSARWKLAVMEVDRPAVLTGHDPTGGERAPVADPLHVVDDRHRGVAGPQEVGVQRVHPRTRRRWCGWPRSAPGRRPVHRTPAGGRSRAGGRGRGRRRGARCRGARPARSAEAGTARAQCPRGRGRRGRPGTARTAARSPRRSAAAGRRPAGCCRLLGAGERVVLLLQRGHHLVDLLVGGEVAGDLGLALLGLLAQRRSGRWSAGPPARRARAERAEARGYSSWAR